MVGVTLEPPGNAESSVNYDCHFENNNTECHVVKMYSSLILLLINFTAILRSYIICMILCLHMVDINLKVFFFFLI